MATKDSLSFNRCFTRYHSNLHHDVNQSTLIMSQVIFRHGQRAPDEVLKYPGDPYANELYLPYGKGEVTLLGRKQCYYFGQQLHQRYADFLERGYRFGLVEAISSEVQRAITSLQIVLAGLLPPCNENAKIHPLLNWDPRPFKYTPIKQDPLFGKAVAGVVLQEDNPEFRRTENSQAVIETVENKLNWKIKRHIDCLFLYDILKTQDECGLISPAWCESIYPKKLFQECVSFTKHNFNRREFIVEGYGSFMKHINDKMVKVATTCENAPKLVLYSGHDTNLAGLLSIIGHFKAEDWPNYLSNLTFELHKFNNQNYVKILYQPGPPKNEFEQNEIQILDLIELPEFTDHVKEFFPLQQNVEFPDRNIIFCDY